MKKSTDSASSKTLLSLHTLHTLSKYIYCNIYQDPETLLNYVLKNIVEITHAKAGNIRVFDQSSQKLILKSSYGVDKKYKKIKFVFAVDVNTSIAGYVFKKNQIYICEDLRKNHLYKFPETEYALDDNILSFLVGPLILSEEKLGTLSLYFPRKTKFQKDEIEFFSILKGLISTLLSFNNLHYKLKRNYLDMAKVLIITLEEKDPYTKGHSERVQQYAVKIAEKMKVPQKTIQILSDFSILHDIGKIIIDSSILTKKDKLTEEEWTIIKKHPETGTKMIEPVNGFIHSVPIIRYHHERIDGKGYPDGLIGIKIPLLAKIMAVADSFDAMTSSRTYRPAMSIEQAKNELIKNVGLQFDENVVKVMLDLINNGEIVLPKSNDIEEQQTK